MSAYIRKSLFRTGLLLIAALVVPLSVNANNIRVWTLKSRPSVTRGEVEVSVPSSEVLGRLTKLKNWPRLFSDIKSVKVLRKEGRTLIAKVDSKSIGHEHTFAFKRDKNQFRFKLVDGHFGGKMSGRFIVLPSGAHTKVRAELFSDVSGLFSIFSSSDGRREDREKKIRRDLSDLQALK